MSNVTFSWNDGAEEELRKQINARVNTTIQNTVDAYKISGDLSDHEMLAKHIDKELQGIGLALPHDQLISIATETERRESVEE